MIEPQSRGDNIDMGLVKYSPVARHKMLGAFIPDIVLRRPQATNIGRRFHTTGVNRNQFRTDADASSFDQQLLNDPFGLLVVAFAKLMMSNESLSIDEIKCRPVVVSEGSPYRMIAIDCDRIVDVYNLHSVANIIEG